MYMGKGMNGLTKRRTNARFDGFNGFWFGLDCGSMNRSEVIGFGHIELHIYPEIMIGR